MNLFDIYKEDNWNRLPEHKPVLVQGYNNNYSDTLPFNFKRKLLEFLSQRQTNKTLKDQYFSSEKLMEVEDDFFKNLSPEDQLNLYNEILRHRANTLERVGDPRIKAFSRMY